MKIIFWIVFTILIVFVLIKYGNKNEMEIRAEYAKIDQKYSYISTSIKIQEIDGHEYVLYNAGGLGAGITHHAGCNNIKCKAR